MVPAPAPAEAGVAPPPEGAIGWRCGCDCAIAVALAIARATATAPAKRRAFTFGWVPVLTVPLSFRIASRIPRSRRGDWEVKQVVFPCGDRPEGPSPPAPKEPGAPADELLLPLVLRGRWPCGSAFFASRDRRERSCHALSISGAGAWRSWQS